MSAYRHRRERRLVQAYLDGELEGAPARAAARHLDLCFDCSRAAETQQLVVRSLRRLTARVTPSLAALRLRRYGRDLARHG